jgi:protein-S-isoprenylcysteine O-methyltransferase Ste14
LSGWELERANAVWDITRMQESPPFSGDAIDLQALQKKRKVVLALGIALWVLLLLFTRSRWQATAPHIHTLIESAGLVLILVCILGRTWCTLYIGGRKKRELITEGPYSVVRNPLYVFTSIGAAGIGAQTGSALVAFLFGAATLAVFDFVARREEVFLESSFPGEFAAYAERVPRFWPRLSSWREADELRVKPHLVRRTFLDACLFLLAVPASDLLALLQRLARLPVLMHLP